MPVSQAAIETASGSFQADIITPDGARPWPAILVFFDAGGRRPAMTQIAERIAKSGYIVAIPDIFHRGGTLASILPPGATLEKGITQTIFSNEESKKRFFVEFYGPALAYDNLKADTEATLAYLHGRPDVKPGKFGTTGYCLGGNASYRVATMFGDQVAATAGFHAGGLVSDAPDSPHTRTHKIASTVYIGGASNDASFSDDAKKTLIAALDAAHVKSTVETYPGGHGFAVSDHVGVYDPACAERHFEAMDELFGATLKS